MRNMIEMNKLAFSNLSEQLSDKEQLSIPEGKRYFKTNDLEKEWLKETKIKSIINIIPNYSAIHLEFDSKTYLCLTGSKISNEKFADEVILDMPINAGLLTLFIAKECVKLDQKVNTLEFYNDIMFQDKDEQYMGHDYNEIIKFIEPINLYHIPPNSVLMNQPLKRNICYIYSKNYSLLVLNFDNDILNAISDLSLVGSNNISYDILLNCMLSTDYRHAFLELYRLVERLFPVSYLKEFHQKSKSDLNFIDFISSLEEVTGWRPKEDEALEKMFQLLTDETKMYFDSFFNDFESSRVHHKFFYNLRNSIVHFRASHIEFDLSEKQWNKIIFATLMLIDDNYSFYDNLLG